MDKNLPTGNHHNLTQEGPDAIRWMRTLDADIQLHHEVWEKGYPSRFGAKIPVQSGWNLDKLEQYLRDYEDKDIVEWLKYGWPTGRVPGIPDPGWADRNHKGAEEYPQALKAYIEKELSHKAIMGPYEKIPFSNRVGISPLSTRPKKDSEERRIILDLSFPIGQGVNDGIPGDNYMGFEASLSFPRTDDFAYQIYH